MQQLASTQGFSLGLDWSRPAETIDQRSLVEAMQCEYDREDGALRTVPGIRAIFEFPSTIESLFYDVYRECWYFTTGQTIYKTDFTTTTALGTLTGLSKVVYYPYDGAILVASGGKLQAISGSGILSTIEGSPDCHFVNSNSGSVITANKNTHRVTWSAIGDYTSWTVDTNNSAGAQYVDVGYKDAGEITAVDYLNKVIIVYKEYGKVYQIVGDPHVGNIAVYPLSQTGYCSGSAISIDDRSYYLGNAGLMSFIPTDTYADIQPFETGLNINPWLLKRITSNCKMWHLPNRKQLWILPDHGKDIFLYHYLPRYDDGRGVVTSRVFTHDLYDVVAKDKEVYIAYGNKIGILDEKLDTDDGVQIQTSIISGSKVATRLFLLLFSYNFIANNLISGEGFITISNKTPKRIEFKNKEIKLIEATMDLVDATDKLYQDGYTKVYKIGGSANRSLQVKVQLTKGAISLRQFDYIYEEV